MPCSIIPGIFKIFVGVIKIADMGVITAIQGKRGVPSNKTRAIYRFRMPRPRDF
jgi:hypothetical protein